MLPDMRLCAFGGNNGRSRVDTVVVFSPRLMDLHSLLGGVDMFTFEPPLLNRDQVSRIPAYKLSYFSLSSLFSFRLVRPIGLLAALFTLLFLWSPMHLDFAHLAGISLRC